MKKIKDTVKMLENHGLTRKKARNQWLNEQHNRRKEIAYKFALIYSHKF